MEIERGENWQTDEQAEKDFNESVIEENSELLEKLTNQAQGYIWEARSDKFCVLLKATSNIMLMAQTKMTEMFGINSSNFN